MPKSNGDPVSRWLALPEPQPPMRPPDCQEHLPPEAREAVLAIARAIARSMARRDHEAERGEADAGKAE